MVTVPRMSDPAALFGTTKVQSPAPAAIRPIAGTTFSFTRTRQPTVPEVPPRPVSERVAANPTVNGFPARGRAGFVTIFVKTTFTAVLFARA